MSIIKKIRERAGLAVGVIAVGLGLFVVGGDLLAPNSAILGGNKQIVGEIDGNEISLQEFTSELERVRANYAMATGQPPAEAQMQGLRQEAWNQLIFKYVYLNEFSKLGIEITDNEIIDMVQGNNIHPSIAQLFTNPETGEVDRNAIVNFLKNMNSYSPQDQMSFRNFEQNLRPDRLRTKYESLMSKTYFANSAEARKEYEAQNSTANLRYVYIPYSSIADSSINVSEDEMRDYFAKNQEDYKREPNRSLEYVSFPIKATETDIMALEEEMGRIKQQFELTTNDSAFVDANSDVNENFASMTPGELPSQLDVATIEVGGVYGPFRDGDAFLLYKIRSLTDDTTGYARASHILIQADEDNKAASKASAQDILNQLKNGADFAAMAAQHGTDGTKSRGGDLGWFDENTMVKEFNDAVMNATSLGLLPNLVETQFGYHIIEVTGLKTNQVYDVASVEKEITASSTTIDEIYRRTIDFTLADSRESFISAADKDSTLIRYQALNVRQTARNINNLTDPSIRQIVRWAYTDAEIGDVSEVIQLDDQYIVACLIDATEEGTSPFDEVKDEVKRAVVTEKQKEQILAKLEGLAGTVDDIRSAYGDGAIVSSGTDISMNSTSLPVAGFAPKTIGKIFTMEIGQVSKPVADDTGVIVFEVDKIDEAAEAANLAIYRNQVQDRESRSVSFKVARAVEEFADVENELYKYY